MSLFQPIEDALSDEEMAAMNQWALNTSRGVRNHQVARRYLYRPDKTMEPI